MRSHRWRSVQSGLPESAHGCPELVKHALLVEANGMCRNMADTAADPRLHTAADPRLHTAADPRGTLPQTHVCYIEANTFITLMAHCRRPTSRLRVLPCPHTAPPSPPPVTPIRALRALWFGLPCGLGRVILGRIALARADTTPSSKSTRHTISIASRKTSCHAQPIVGAALLRIVRRALAAMASCLRLLARGDAPPTA